MIDDTLSSQSEGQHQAISPSQTCLSTNLANILKEPVVRAHATRWAKNLSFLTFDEGDATALSDDATPQTDDYPKGLCGMCESGRRILPGHHCDDHVGAIDKIGNKEREEKTTESSDGEENDACAHVRGRSCANCWHIPLFPNKKEVTRFKIRRLTHDGLRQQCDHFIPVSYCWSSDQRTQDEAPYQVTEEDGTVREARAPSSVIRRAVQFARDNGCRLIWIDQECINQANPVEKELAIQAIDYIYLHANISIGLFNTVLEPKHWRSLVTAADARLRSIFQNRRGNPNGFKSRRCKARDLIEAITRITTDRWNTRAWILQEAFASSGNMCLLFPRHADYKVDGSPLFCHERSQDDLVVGFELMHGLLQWQSMFMRHALAAAPKSEEVPYPVKCPPSRDRVPRQSLLAAIDSIDRFHPPKPTRSDWNVYIHLAKPRRTCSAATALKYLQSRGLERTADKLAIVANMCDYPLRLDSTRLENEDIGLGVCLMVLSMSNGDFSLLIPELYRGLRTAPPTFPSVEDSEFSWVHSYTKALQHLHPPSYNDSSALSRPNAPTSAQLSADGLRLLGTMWEVKEFLDMDSLRVKYADSWLRLRKATDRQRPGLKTIQRATTHMLFEIITHLKNIGETKIANCILNSTSDFWWRHGLDGKINNPIESVDQFPPGLTLEGRKNMFQLDQSADGFFSECWIIDRVMENGGLWIASPVRPPGSHWLQEEEDIDTDDPMTEKAMSHASHLMVMRMLEINTAEVETTEMEQLVPDGEEVTKHLATWPVVLSGFASLVSQPTTDLFTRKALFDINHAKGETNIIFTPYQMTLESLPRPAIRSLGVSWAVVPYKNDHMHDEAMETFRVHNMVKGMWQFSTQFTDRYCFA